MILGKTLVIDFFNVFYFVQRFFCLKTFIENPIKSFVKHFWDHKNELISNNDVIYYS